MAKTKTKSDAETLNINTQAEPKTTSKSVNKQTASEKSNDETAPSNDEPKKDGDSGGRGVTFWIILGIGGSIGLCLLLFVVAIIVGVASGKWENVASMIAIVRDLMIILLVMEGILVGVALIFMILQLSLLLNVLQNEIKPILENAQQTASTVKGTASFVSKQVASPIIRVKSTLAGTRAFFRGVSDFRAMTSKPTKTAQNDNDDKKESPDQSLDDDKAK